MFLRVMKPNTADLAVVPAIGPKAGKTAFTTTGYHHRFSENQFWRSTDGRSPLAGLGESGAGALRVP